MPCADSFNGSLYEFYGCIVYHNPIKGQLNHLLSKHKTLCLKCHCAVHDKSSCERTELHLEEM